MLQRIILCQYINASQFVRLRYARGREGHFMAEFGALLVVVGFVLALVLAIAWILMPLMLAGVRTGVRDMVRQQQRTNELLEALLHERSGVTSTAAQRADVPPPPRDTLLDRRYPPA